MYRCAPSYAAPPSFSACFPVSFCAACSLVPILRPHTRSIRASSQLPDRSSRDVPLFSPRLARHGVSVLVSVFRARDRVVSLLPYSVIHALSLTASLPRPFLTLPSLTLPSHVNRSIRVCIARLFIWQHDTETNSNCLIIKIIASG